MSNSECILEELKLRCDGKHKHQPLMSGRAKHAARYPVGLCEAICRGLSREKHQRQLKVKRLCTLRACDKIGKVQDCE
eukprot:11424614-Karenia_brevis.AAC.1